MAKRSETAAELPCSATAMRKATRRLTQLYDDAVEQCGLRSTQFTILAELHLRPHAPPTMAELASLLVMDRSALGHNLQPLLRDGLLVLKESDEDRRRRYVTMTPQGRAKFKLALKLWQNAEDRFRSIFGASRAAGLRATLLEIARDERLATLSDQLLADQLPADQLPADQLLTDRRDADPITDALDAQNRLRLADRERN